MKTVNRLCETCGARIFDDATREVCPACLLESDLALFADESATAARDPHRDDSMRGADNKKVLRPAAMLVDFGEYELLEEIGRRKGPRFQKLCEEKQP